MNFLIKLILILSALPISLFAQTNLSNNDAASEERVTLTVAIEEVGYFPFNYRENDELKGLSIDVLRYFEANSNYNFEFKTVPWPRALQLTSVGKLDLILTLFQTPERKKTYHFIEPNYAFEANQLFTLIDSQIEFSGQLEQLTPYSIATLREYSYGEYFDNAHYLKTLPALTEEVLLKLLVAKRADMVISNPLFFEKLASKKKLTTKIKALKPFVSVTPVYMALTKGREDSQEIHKKLSQLTKQFKASTHYQELLTKYQLNYKRQ